MRRETILLLLAGLTGAEPAAAQGFGWLLGEPPPSYRRAPRTQRRPSGIADVPLPVPRPRFAGDAAPAAEIAKAPELSAEPSGAASPPLPPERPQQGDLQPAPAQAATPLPSEELTPPKKDAGLEPRGRVEPASPTATPPSVASAAPPDQPATPPLPPPKPADLVAPPAVPSTPTVAPSGATTAFNPREPAADAGCADRIKARGVVAEATTLPPQPDVRCTVVQPMRLVSATLEDGATVTFPDKPTIACTTADAFSAYVHDLLAPLARGTWGVGLASVWTGPGLECRSRDHVFGAKLSAHGQGLAVDIAQLKLGDGRIVAVGEPNTDAEQHFETAARAGGCGYFHTVLGPGSDSYHRTHWHFDLEVRGREGDGKYCK